MAFDILDVLLLAANGMVRRGLAVVVQMKAMLGDPPPGIGI
jgi:hypothetical protein